jgi:hypothetical protein
MSGNDIEVLLVDQQRINSFSRLNLRMKELDVEIEGLKVRTFMNICAKLKIQSRVQTCKDAIEEAEMCLDPNGMR